MLNKKILTISIVIIFLILSFLPIANSQNNKIISSKINKYVLEKPINDYKVMIDPIPLDPKKASPKPEIIDTPSEFSWKKYNENDWTTYVKNQGECGSCWAFAAVAVLESVINIKEGFSELNPDLSEQYILSCLPESGSCRGGSSFRAFMLIKDTTSAGNNCNGIIPESCFSYQSNYDYTPECSEKCQTWQDQLIPITDFGFWESDGTEQDREAIKTEIIQKGPVCAGIKATDSFKKWGGIFHNPEGYYPYTGPEEWINHVVVILGWKDDPTITNGGYWICKNSWGTQWGYNGLFNIEYGALNIDKSSIIWVEYDPESYQWPCETTNAPNKPILTGEEDGKIIRNYIYTAKTNDQDNDQIYYQFSWGDDTYSDWLGPYESDENCEVEHMWLQAGNFQVKVKAKDEHGAQSQWASLDVSIPKNKANNFYHQLLKTLEKYTILHKLISIIFEF